MPEHSSHLQQPLDIGYSSMLKRAYGRLVENQARTGYNHIDKLDFLAAYPKACAEAFKPGIIQNGFAAAGLIPVDAEHVLSKLNRFMMSDCGADNKEYEPRNVSGADYKE